MDLVAVKTPFGTVYVDKASVSIISKLVAQNIALRDQLDTVMRRSHPMDFDSPAYD